MNVTSLMNVTGNGKAYAIEDHPLQVEQHFDQRVPDIKRRCEEVGDNASTSFYTRVRLALDWKCLDLIGPFGGNSWRFDRTVLKS